MHWLCCWEEGTDESSESPAFSVVSSREGNWGGLVTQSEIFKGFVLRMSSPAYFF
jgi:hypothetical protein